MEEMFITPIQPLSMTQIQPIRPISLSSGMDRIPEVKGQEGISAFKSIFESAIDNVRTTEDTLTKEQYLLATGQIEDPHTVGIAESNAQLSVDLLVALRSAALQSYNEMMRISS